MTSNIVFSEKKQKDMEWAKGIVSRIEADRRKFVKYKDSRPIADIKHMIETSAELYGDNTAFYQKYKGDETFTAISYETDDRKSQRTRYGVDPSRSAGEAHCGDRRKQQ